MEEYVELKLEPNMYYNYESTIKNHILPHLGKYKVKSLTPHILQQFINLKTREGYARQTLSIIIGILSKSLNHAVYPYKYIKENPMHYVELMKDKSRKPTREDLKIQSKENLRRINNVLNEDHPFYLPFHIGLHCGLRVGEVCGLEWKQINFEEMTLEVEQQLVGIKDDNGKIHWQPRPPKSKAGYRTIPFGNTLTEMLKRAKKKTVRKSFKVWSVL